MILSDSYRRRIRTKNAAVLLGQIMLWLLFSVATTSRAEVGSSSTGGHARVRPTTTTVRAKHGPLPPVASSLFQKTMSSSSYRTIRQPFLVELRGGAARFRVGDEDDDDDNDENEEEEVDEEDDDDEEEETFLFDMNDMDEALGTMSESDFAEESTWDRWVDAWKKTPPLTKGYLTASMMATVSGFVFFKNEFPSILLLEYKPAIFRLQIWRFFTSFLNFGPLGLGYLMTAQFVWTYMSTLERLHHDRPYDFWIMMLFGMGSMVLGYPLLQLSPRFLGHNLSTFLVYIWSRTHEGLEVNMFELFNTRAELLPWFFLAQTFLLEGELPILDLLGIVFGHVYHHVKTMGWLRAPPAWRQWYRGPSTLATRIRALYQPISSDFERV